MGGWFRRETGIWGHYNSQSQCRLVEGKAVQHREDFNDFIGHFYFPCQDAEVNNGMFQAILYLFKYYKVSNCSTLHCKNYHICLWMQLPFSILTWYSSSLAAETSIQRPEYCNSYYLCFRVLYRILTQISRNTKRKKEELFGEDEYFTYTKEAVLRNLMKTSGLWTGSIKTNEEIQISHFH